MDVKLTNVIRGAFIIVLGVLIAVCGIGTAVNTYFGVVSIVAGVLMLCFAGFAMYKKLPVPVGYFILSGVFITVAVALFMGKLSFAELVNLLIFVIMGLGFAFAVLGIIYITKRWVVQGLVSIIAGALLILFTALYLGIPEFQTAFWIICGILMIIFGVFVIVATLMGDRKYIKR